MLLIFRAGWRPNFIVCCQGAITGVVVLLEQPLLIVEESVHVALQLGRGCATDETELVGVQHAPK